MSASECPLLSAVRAGSVADVLSQLCSGIYDSDANKLTEALYVAAECGSTEMCIALAARGARPGRTAELNPLCIGINKNHVHVVDALLSLRIVILPDVDDEGEEDDTLHLAVETGNPDMVRTILRHGADVNGKSSVPIKDTTPLHCVVNGEVAQILIDAGADVHAKASDDGMPVHSIAAQGSVSAMKVVFANGGDINAVATNDTYGFTPLMYAAGEGKLEMMQYLVSAGADIHFKDPYKNIDALDIAIINRNYDISLFLLQLGSKIHDGSLLKLTSNFHRRSVPENLIDYFYSLLDILLKTHPAGINAADDNKITPLHHLVAAAVSWSTTCPQAQRQLAVDAIGKLLDAGADACAAEIYRKTALHTIAETYSDIAKSLSSNPDELTQTVEALQGIFRDILHRLVNAGLRPTRTVYGYTPLHMLKEEYKSADELPTPLCPVVVDFMVIAGDRSWDCVPVPCPGIGAAIESVWKDAEDELPILFFTMTEEDQDRCREGLRAMHRRLGGEKDLQMKILSLALTED